MQRSDSFESIPEVEFIKDVIAEENKALDNSISLFKLRENNKELLPEPLLTEDKSRFVLFPIKHTDVSFDQNHLTSSPFILFFPLLCFLYLRYGKCTKRPKHHFGLLKKLT